MGEGLEVEELLLVGVFGIEDGIDNPAGELHAIESFAGGHGLIDGFKLHKDEPEAGSVGTYELTVAVPVRVGLGSSMVTGLPYF